MVNTTIPDDLKQVTLRLMDAWVNKDRQELLQVLDDDVLFVSEIVKEYHLKKHDYIETMVERFPIKSYKLNFLRVALQAANQTAVTQLTVQFPGASIGGNEVSYLVTDVWNIYNGEWKLLLRKSVSLE